jgi:hypothetical protein
VAGRRPFFDQSGERSVPDGAEEDGHCSPFLCGGRWRTQHDTRMLGVSRDHISVSPFEGGRRGGEVGQGSRCQKVQLTSVESGQHPCSAEPRLLSDFGNGKRSGRPGSIDTESQLDDG